MAASYWARWACNGQISDLSELILPYLLEEGYELLSHDTDRQVFDRGGIMKKIAWTLSPGHWQDAPLDLTITYSYSTTQTIANFYWKLTTRPLPATAKEQALFAAQIQLQLSRIITQINRQLLEEPSEPLAEAAREGASLQAYWEHAQEDPEEATSTCPMALATGTHEDQPDATLTTAAAYVDEPIRCDMCHRPAVPLAGANNRHYCLLCRHHLPHQIAAHQGIV